MKKILIFLEKGKRRRGKVAAYTYLEARMTTIVLGCRK
jgi:hypothetical protein